ncbi:type I-B CRISPR-associated protein Cas8b1/Cst1 [Listeria ilorinensis]|uniref:type I-B CRISPR-associated protein Cas8b1/Cst1 n=1 Tax=Listeria ilorinensis TaxID=2867439 RepID=UPI001EF4E137|nr:type I-B CRISPR-associated protein Cas8b1/Cst1 [Listeria ilorinensis]
MEELEFKLGDWLYNAGIVGLIRILKPENVRLSDQSVFIRKEALEDFETKYFDYFIETYKETLAWHRVVSYQKVIDHFRNTDFENFKEESLKSINEQIAFVKKTLKANSSVAAYPLIDEASNPLLWEKQLKPLKGLKKKEKFHDKKEELIQNVEEMFAVLEEVIQYFDQPSGRKYLAGKNVIYTIIKNGWSGVSFLNRTPKEKDMYKDFNVSFVNPAIEYLEAEHEKDKFECFCCGRQIKNLDLGFSFLNEVGFDVARKNSHVWDFDNDIATCPLCRLVYACLPAGFTYVYGKGMFINCNVSVDQLLKANNQVRNQVFNDPANMNSVTTYKAMVHSIQESERKETRYELADVQIIRYENETYHFNILSKHVLEIIYQEKKKFKAIENCSFKEGNVYVWVYQEVLSKLMNSENLFRLIHKMIHYKITNMGNAFYNLHQVLCLLEINHKFLEEVSGLELSKEQLNLARYKGNELRKAYLEKNSVHKIDGINHKLLNALKTNNCYDFMDITLRAYSYTKKPAPNILLEAFKSAESFKTVGYAFVLGLQGEKNMDGGKQDAK